MNTQNTVKLIVVLFVMTCTVMSYSDANSFFLTRPDWQPPWCSDLRVKWKDRPCENDVAVEVSYQGQMEGGSRFLFQAYGLPRTSTSRCAKLTLEVKGLEKFGITRLEGFIDGLFEESLSGATFHKTYNFNFIDQEMTQETISRHEESGMGEWDAMYEATKESIEKRGGEVYGRKLYDMVHNVSVGKVTCRIYEKDEADRSDEPVEADQSDEPVEADQLDEPVEADQSDEPVKADQLDEPVKADQLDEPVKADQLDEPARADQSDEPARADQSDEPVKADQSDESARDDLKDLIRLEEREMLEEEKKEYGTLGSPGGPMNLGGAMNRKRNDACERAKRRAAQTIPRITPSNSMCTTYRTALRMFESARRILSSNGCPAHEVRQYDRAIAQTKRGVRAVCAGIH